MRKKAAKVLALALAAAMVLSACGGGSSSGGSGNGGASGGAASGSENAGSGDNASSSGVGEASHAITDLVTYESQNNEQEGFLMQNTEKSADLNVLCNVYSPLLEVNNKGQLVPAVATEWGTDDGGLTWTFKLRDDVKWVDYNGNVMADCTAQDWITGLEWVMNFHKNGSNNTSMPSALIAGADDYLQYTKGLSPEEAMSMDNTKFLEMVGIEAPDDYTLIYHCTQNAPYFDTVCTSACLYPLSQALVDTLGVENMVGMTNEQMWCNGAYIEKEYINSNSKTLVPNPEYWDKDAQRFDSVTIRITDATQAYQLFENGEIDHVSLDESTLRAIYDDEGHQYHNNLAEMRPRKYSYQMHLNYSKNNEDGTPDDNWNKAVANEAFRLAWYYGLDLTDYWARYNFIYPLHCENLAYTMKGLLYFSDGTDYADRVVEKLGVPASDGATPRRLNKELFEKYKAQAMEELAAEGVTFPVEADAYIAANSQTALDTYNVLKQIFSESLGDDFVTLNIGTYVSSLSQEVIVPRKQSFQINGWGADYGDPANFVDQERYGYDGAYYAKNYSNINDATDEDLIATYKEFSEMAEKAGEICDDMDARYDAYVDAEVFMLQHALVIPCYYDVSWELTKINDYTKMYAMYGAQNYTYKNWETSVDAYTTEQYDAFKAAAGE